MRRMDIKYLAGAIDLQDKIYSLVRRARLIANDAVIRSEPLDKPYTFIGKRVAVKDLRHGPYVSISDVEVNAST